jgi:type II secretory pathway pseudopilin PulG
MLPLVTSSGDRRPKRGTQGFSLVELVVVVSLVIIVTGIVTPRLRVSPVRRVEGMAQQMVAHLELARSHSLGSRQLTRVVFDETKRTYTAYVDDNRDGTIAEIAAEMDAFPEFGNRELEDFVDFGRGNAASIPGDTLALAVTLTDNKLNLSVQGVPEPWGTMGTVYLVHRDDKNAVSAISIASSGSFKAWRWWPDEGEWR